MQYYIWVVGTDWVPICPKMILLDMVSYWAMVGTVLIIDLLSSFCNNNDMHCFLIYGPTLTGKIELAITLSKYLWGRYNKSSVLISADSRKVYKGMHVMQSYPYKNLVKKYDIKLVNFLPINKTWTVDDFLFRARKYLCNAVKNNVAPIIFGGTGIYFKALLENWPNKTHNDKEFMQCDSTSHMVLISPTFNKSVLYKRLERHTKKLVSRGLIQEYDYLSKKCVHGKFCALHNTLGYKQVYEIKKRYKCVVPNKLVPFLRAELKNFARKQIKFYKNLPKPFWIKNKNDIKLIADKFMQ